MASWQPTADQIAQVKAECVKAWDARHGMAEHVFWDVKYATVLECWEHCHGGVSNPQREVRLAHFRQIIADAQGRINEICQGEDWQNHPAFDPWWTAENTIREAALAVLLKEMEY